MDSRVRAALAVPGRVSAQVGQAITAGGRMLFTIAQRAWYQVVYSRTRYDYRGEIGDPLQNSIVAALLGWIARNFPEAPLRITRLTSQGPEAAVPGPTGAGALLRLLERPNEWYSGPLLWAATIIDYMVADAYWYKVRAGNGRVVALWWIPSWMIEPRWDERDPYEFIGWYEYTVDGLPYRLEARDVIHFRNGIDPKNTRKGLGRLGSLFRELFTDNEASAMTAALMRNLGVPGVIIAPANTNSGPMKANTDKIKERFVETFGGDNRGMPMVLSRPTEVKVLSWSPEQMNLRELRRIPEERASAVIGVPAGVAGLGAGLDRNTFSNYGEANVAAYTQGVIPLQRLLAADIEVQLLDEFVDLDDGWDAEFDWTQVKAMAPFVDQLWKRYGDAAVKGLITRADFRRGTYQSVDPGGADEVYIAPNNYVFTPVVPARRLATASGVPLALAGGEVEPGLPLLTNGSNGGHIS